MIKKTTDTVPTNVPAAQEPEYSTICGLIASTEVEMRLGRESGIMLLS